MARRPDKHTAELLTAIQTLVWDFEEKSGKNLLELSIRRGEDFKDEDFEASHFDVSMKAKRARRSRVGIVKAWRIGPVL